MCSFLLHCLLQPPPPFSRHCPCGRPLHIHGVHRATCARAVRGRWRRRGLACDCSGSAAARDCPARGAQVTTNAAPMDSPRSRRRRASCHRPHYVCDGSARTRSSRLRRCGAVHAIPLPSSLCVSNLSSVLFDRFAPKSFHHCDGNEGQQKHIHTV